MFTVQSCMADTVLTQKDSCVLMQSNSVSTQGFSCVNTRSSAHVVSAIPK